jgi:hypothetical protein
MANAVGKISAHTHKERERQRKRRCCEIVKAVLLRLITCDALGRLFDLAGHMHTRSADDLRRGNRLGTFRSTACVRQEPYKLVVHG